MENTEYKKFRAYLKIIDCIGSCVNGYQLCGCNKMIQLFERMFNSKKDYKSFNYSRSLRMIESDKWDDLVKTTEKDRVIRFTPNQLDQINKDVEVGQINKYGDFEYGEGY